MFETITYLSQDGKLNSNAPKIDDETLIKGLKVMIQTRLVDERMITLQRQGSISFALSSAGEEACSVASAAALDLGDWMYPQYRETGVLFWRGFSIENYVHHMFGDAKDLIYGRQMPNHFGSRKLNVVTVSSPIGTKIPHAAGCAYALKLLKKPNVAICYFGEGASSEGDFHVGLNFAAVRKCPAIFFCRNNYYAISTPAFRQFASDGVAPKGEGYGMATVRVDGNDFFAVYDAVKKAKERGGPSLIEAMTYRMGAHSTSDDPTRYRKEEDLNKWKTCCPIDRLTLYLKSKNLWDDQKTENWEAHVQKEIDQAIEIALKTPKPDVHTLIEHVYFEVPEDLQNELDEVMPHD